MLSFDVMKKLTHGTVHKVTASGRVAEVWPGAISAIEKALKNHCHNIVNRDGR